MGYNVNVVWTGGVDFFIGDVEYLTVFRWGLRRVKGGVGILGFCCGRDRRYLVRCGWRGLFFGGI